MIRTAKTRATAAGAKAQELGCASMWGRVREGDEASLNFTAHRRFEEVNRDVDVLLEITPDDGEVAPGIVELREEHLRGAYAVAAECIPEMALPQHAEVRPYDEWLAQEERNSPVAFVALDSDEVVGYARLHSISALPHRLENGFTGVLRGHRRRGIATAAAANGIRELVTWTQTGNESMQAVNAGLGYVTTEIDLAFARSLPL